VRVGRPQTREKCGSERDVEGLLIRRERITYKSPGFAACSHIWGAGVSGIAPTLPVSDGEIILVKQGAAYGAIILRNQRADPKETVEYDWHYRTDGKGTFRSAESGTLQSGKGEGSPVEFGPFSLRWSGYGPGKGFIYYSLPSGPSGPDDLRICVTAETDIEAIDASDVRWVYTASPNHPAVRRERIQ
jgi:hypothetical protein